MLISCNYCSSKYLVNSADLKPNGRTVQCATCGNQWYQDTAINENDEIEEKILTSVPSSIKQNKKNYLKSPIPNLPSTYVKVEKVSYLNSFLVIFFLAILIGVFWILKNLDLNSFILIKYYLNEFTFNLKLIFVDIANVIYQILN